MSSPFWPSTILYATMYFMNLYDELTWIHPSITVHPSWWGCNMMSPMVLWKSPFSPRCSSMSTCPELSLSTMLKTLSIKRRSSCRTPPPALKIRLCFPGIKHDRSPKQRGSHILPWCHERTESGLVDFGSLETSSEHEVLGPVCSGEFKIGMGAPVHCWAPLRQLQLKCLINA